MEKYNFIVYQNENGFVQQITNTNISDLPMIPEEDGVTAAHVNFYNDITESYYEPATGKFYADEAKTEEIADPATYVKPVIEVESDPLYTLDEAAQILSEEVANEL